jgi:hypothetical protein
MRPELISQAETDRKRGSEVLSVAAITPLWAPTIAFEIAKPKPNLPNCLTRSLSPCSNGAKIFGMIVASIPIPESGLVSVRNFQ